VLTSALVLILVLVLWCAVKHSLKSYRKTPLRRGVYEALYEKFPRDRPDLWNQHGPCKDFKPDKFWEFLKWELVTRWFHSDKVKPIPPFDPLDRSLGVLSDAKRNLAKG